MTDEEIAEKIKYYFIEENMTVKEAAKKLNISLYKINKIKKIYNIKKSKELLKERCKKSCKRTEEEQQKINEKRKQTCLEKYGVEYNWQAEEIKEKSKQTLKERYGSEKLRDIEEINQKRKTTCMERYGGDTPFHNKKIQEQATKTLCDHYGRRSSTTNLSEKAIEVFKNKKNFEKFLLSIPDEERTLYEIEKRLEYSGPLFTKYYHKYELEYIKYKSSNHSKYEYEIYDLLNYWNIKAQIGNHKILEGLEIDIYLPDFKIGIEFNGNYWHNDEHKEKNYHQEKALRALKKNIFIYQIWEHEWKDNNKKQIIISQLKNLIGQSERIYARKTELKKITAKDCHIFLNENHLQGFRPATEYYGLYYNNELISCMTFGKNYVGKSENIELLRFCNKKNVTIVGGASKLFNGFLKNNKECKKVISYCNLSKGKGNLYLKLGMSFSRITQPNYIWVSSQGKVKSRYTTQMKGEDAIMREQGYYKNYDSGNLEFIWEQNI